MLNDEMPGLIQRLLPKYRKVVSDLLDTLVQAGTGPARDFSAIESVGHRFKGNGAMYGFKDLTDLGGKLESEAKRKNEEQVDDLMLQIFDCTRSHGLDARQQR